MNPSNGQQMSATQEPQSSPNSAPQHALDLATATNLHPAVFVDAASNALGLNIEHRRELHTFRLLGAQDMSNGALNMAIYTQASILDIRQAMTAMSQSVSRVDTTVTSMKAKATEQAEANLSPLQRTSINKACKVALFNTHRRDFENSAIIPAAKAILRRRKDTNGLAQYFRGDGEDIHKAVMSWLSAKATSAKGELRKNLLCTAKRGRGRLSLSEATQRAMKTFLDDSPPELEHLLFMLVLREFARIMIKTPADKAIGLKRSIDNVAADDEDSAAAKAAREAKEALDFWSIITGMFSQRASWGKDWKTPQWQSFIANALNTEQLDFPQDPLSGIPLEYKSNSATTHGSTSRTPLAPHASPAERLANALPPAFRGTHSAQLGAPQPSPSPTLGHLGDGFQGPPATRIDYPLGLSSSSQFGGQAAWPLDIQSSQPTGALTGMGHTSSPLPNARALSRTPSGTEASSSSQTMWDADSSAAGTATGQGGNTQRAFIGFGAASLHNMLN